MTENYVRSMWRGNPISGSGDAKVWKCKIPSFQFNSCGKEGLGEIARPDSPLPLFPFAQTGCHLITTVATCGSHPFQEIRKVLLSTKFSQQETHVCINICFAPYQGLTFSFLEISCCVYPLRLGRFWETNRKPTSWSFPLRQTQVARRKWCVVFEAAAEMTSPWSWPRDASSARDSRDADGVAASATARSARMCPGEGGSN